MTEYYCGQCGDLLFNNGNENGERIYEDLCNFCKYGEEIE